MVLTQERELDNTLQVQNSSPCAGAMKFKKKKKEKQPQSYVRKSNSENVFVPVWIKKTDYPRHTIEEDIATTEGLQGLITKAVIVVYKVIREKKPNI